MDFLPPALAEYIDRHSDAEPPLLTELAVATRERFADHRMLSGHVVGRLLSLVSKLVQPQLVIEVGTFTGYSALCLAEGLVEGGRLLTFEYADANAEFAAGWFQKAQRTRQIELHIGPATETLPRELRQLKRPVDLAFIDADKENYLNYYQQLVPALRPGGVILTDNVLWSGKVVDNSVSDAETVAIREFNMYVAQDERVEHVILPLRDGVSLIRKR